MNPDHWTLHMQINNFLNSALKKTLKLHVPLPVLEKLKLLKSRYIYMTYPCILSRSMENKLRF